MRHIEDVNESNRRLAAAFASRLDDLLDEIIEIDEQMGQRSDSPTFMTVGKLQAMWVMEQPSCSDHVLTEDNLALLRKAFDTDVSSDTPRLDKQSLEELHHWFSADIHEKWLAFCFWTWTENVQGNLSEDKGLYLLGMANRALGFFRHLAVPSEKEIFRTFARKGAEALHKKKGFKERKTALREIWASGKYTHRDLCAEQEYEAMDMSYSTARKALQNTPKPIR